MRHRYLFLAPLFALGATACSPDRILDVDPATVVEADKAITDVVSARAAAAGLYDALQSQDYYGGRLQIMSEFLSDNGAHVGTFSDFREADQNRLTALNLSVSPMWSAVYRSIARANAVLEAVPNVGELTTAERDQILGEAYFVRALSHLNATTLWGDAALITAVIRTPAEAGEVTNATQAALFAQIHADLDTAETLLSDGSSTRANVAAVRALRARTALFQQEWAAAEAAAEAVLAMGDHELVDDYASLFTASGSATSEDIFRLAFNDQDSHILSYWYLAKPVGGRLELGPTANFINGYEANDLRRAVTIGQTGTTRYVAKLGSGLAGSEHLHVIRLAEVILIKAEAEARQGKLAEAVASYNLVRERAGLAPHVLGVHVTTQQEVLDAIVRERRYELAFEGFRWQDLVRTGTAVATLGLQERPHQVLLPIPKREIDVSNLEQNPGY